MRAHRYTYMVVNGVVLTSDEKVCHTCDNPPCINPAHLFVGTQSDNISDMWSKGRGALQRIHTA